VTIRELVILTLVGIAIAVTVWLITGMLGADD
jgi:hypothetical protein